jgi:hypothetical protein
VVVVASGWPFRPVMRWRTEPSPALAEQLRRDDELDRILDGRGLSFEKGRLVVPQPPPPKPSVILPFVVEGSSFVDPPSRSRSRSPASKPAQSLEARAAKRKGWFSKEQP